MTRLLGASAVTLGRRILLSQDAAGEVARGTEIGRRLIRHEIAHVAQYERHGFLPFLARYVSAYLDGRRRGLSHAQAYLEIPFEREAERAEG